MCNGNGKEEKCREKVACFRKKSTGKKAASRKKSRG